MGCGVSFLIVIMQIVSGYEYHSHWGMAAIFLGYSQAYILVGALMSLLMMELGS